MPPKPERENQVENNCPPVQQVPLKEQPEEIV